MEYVPRFLPRFDRKELLRQCNEKMVSAARDLAEFTRHGVTADFIVELANKCESLEKMLKGNLPFSLGKELQKLEQEIRAGLVFICETGRRIWADDPAKYNQYVLQLAG